MPRLFATLTASTCPHHLVGYKGEGLAEDNFSMIGVPFTAVDGGDVDLNKVLTCTGVSGCDWGDSDVCDFIHVYINNNDGSRNWYFFYYNTELNMWANVDGDTPFAETFKDGIPAGTTMWFEANVNGQRDDNLSFTFAGAVKGSDEVKLTTLSGSNFNMVSNPYPVAYDLNNEKAIKFTGVSGCDWGDSDVCDFIHVYINNTTGARNWYFFYYNTELNMWANVDGDTPFAETFKDGISASWWYEGNPSGVRDDDLTITFFSPLKKSAE